MCEAYGWTLREAMKLTMPQIIMLNHGSWYNNQRHERQYKEQQERQANNPSAAPAHRPSSKYQSFSTAPDFSSMTSEEIVAHVMVGDDF